MPYSVMRTIGFEKTEILAVAIDASLNTKKVFLGWGCLLKDTPVCVSFDQKLKDCHRCTIAREDHRILREILGGIPLDTNIYPDIGCMGTAFIFNPELLKPVHVIFENREDGGMNQTRLSLIPEGTWGVVDKTLSENSK